MNTKKSNHIFSRQSITNELLHQIKIRANLWSPMAKMLAIFMVMLGANQAWAASFDTPGVSTVDGLQDAEDPGDMIKVIGIWVLQVISWIVALVTGLVVMKNVGKSIAKVHRDEDAKWGNVIGEIVGNIVVFLFVLGFVVWMNAQFT
jgi:hypothetical protein